MKEERIILKYPATKNKKESAQLIITDEANQQENLMGVFLDIKDLSKTNVLIDIVESIDFIGKFVSKETITRIVIHNDKIPFVLTSDGIDIKEGAAVDQSKLKTTSQFISTNSSKILFSYKGSDKIFLTSKDGPIGYAIHIKDEKDKFVATYIVLESIGNYSPKDMEKILSDIFN